MRKWKKPNQQNIKHLDLTGNKMQKSKTSASELAEMLAKEILYIVKIHISIEQKKSAITSLLTRKLVLLVDSSNDATKDCTIAAMVQEREELIKDKERLDWSIEHPYSFSKLSCYIRGGKLDITRTRLAIDSAMKKGTE
jgi:hypothetical protein